MPKLIKKRPVTLWSTFRSTVTEHRLFRAGDTVVVAVSGGPDSVALLHLLHELKEVYSLNLHVAHFDHGLRGVESEADAVFVRNLAQEVGAPFYLGQGDVLAAKKKNRFSLEEACRELRYSFLGEVAEKTGAQRVALGHTADDQVEEFLIRLIRGSGSRGLSGMSFVRDGIFVRPLLRASRADILSYLEANGFSFRLDSSNDSRDFLRNRIRHDLLPILEGAFNPGIRRIFLQIASILGDDNALLTDMAEVAWARVAKVKDGREGPTIVFDLMSYREMPKPIQMRMVQKGLKLCGARLKDIGFRHMESIQNLARPDGPYRMFFLPGKVLVERIYRELVFSRRTTVERTAKDYAYEIHRVGRYSLPEIGRTISFAEVEDLNFPISHDSHRSSYFDYGRNLFPLVVRNFRPGDRFYPDGLGGSQKVKDYFINEKIPRTSRSKVPIVEKSGQIAGIVGWRIDERFKITEKTERILKVSLD